MPPADLDEFAQLSTLGVDSLTAVELRLWVQSDLGVEPAIEQLFTIPSIRDLAVEIDKMLGGESQAPIVTDGHSAHEDRPRWVIASQPRLDAKFRLFCFPYAGGRRVGL